MALGAIGIWRRHQQGTGGLEEIEALGYGALWIGGEPVPDRRSAVPRGDEHDHRGHGDPQRLAARAGRGRRGGTPSWRRPFPGGSSSGSGSAIPRRPVGTTSRSRRCASTSTAWTPPTRPSPGTSAWRRRSARRCSTWRRSARSARTRTSPRPSTRDPPASGSVRTPSWRRSSPSWSSRTPRAPARSRASSRRDTSAGRTTRRTSCALATERDLAGGGSDRLIDAVIPARPG